MREETCCHHIGYSFRLTARVVLYASSHRHDNTYHGLCYTSHGALAETWLFLVFYLINGRNMFLIFAQLDKLVLTWYRYRCQPALVANTWLHQSWSTGWIEIKMLLLYSPILYGWPRIFGRVHFDHDDAEQEEERSHWETDSIHREIADKLVTLLLGSYLERHPVSPDISYKVFTQPRYLESNINQQWVNHTFLTSSLPFLYLHSSFSLYIFIPPFSLTHSSLSLCVYTHIHSSGWSRKDHPSYIHIPTYIHTCSIPV